MLVYIVSSGRIIAKIPKGQPYDYLHEDEELGSFNFDSTINFNKFLIVNNELVELNDEEVLELERYGEILSDEERFENDLLDKLKPSHDEIKKAEQTIEILSLFQEVI